MTILLAIIPGCCGLAFLWQTTAQFLRAPNRYRWWSWLSGICVLFSSLIFLYMLMLDRIAPTLLTEAPHLIAHQLSNLGLMLAIYFSNLYPDDIVYGLHHPIARRHHRIITSFFLVTTVGAAVFFVRALVQGENETPSLLYAVPLQNPNLMLVSILILLFEVVMIWRITRFCWRFAQITPMRAMKATNLLFVTVGGLALTVCGLAGIGIVTPAASAFGHALVSLVMFITLISIVLLVVASLMVNHPGKRLVALGTGIWDMVSLIRLYPLWSLLTNAVPDAIPPVRPLGWWYIVRHLGAFRDQHIIEILDVVHRLEVLLWSDFARSEHWRTQVFPFPNEVIDGTTPALQMREVEQHALSDACKLVVALAAYRPADDSTHALNDPAIYAVLSRPPAFSDQEIHYLELVSRAVHRVRARVYPQGQTPEGLGVAVPSAAQVEEAMR